MTERKKKRTATRTVWICALLTGAAATLAFLRYGTGDRKPDLRYETVVVDRGRIAARVTATGILSALVTVQVGSQVSGRLQQIDVDFNSPVKKGQKIAQIDPQLFEATVGQAKANVVAAEGGLAKAKAQAIDAVRQYERNRELFAKEYVSRADLDTAQANAESAKAQIEVARGAVEQTKAALHQADVNLGYTTIVSPTDGVVISRNVDVGQTVAASLQAPTLFVIAEDLRKMQVDTSVAEADIGKLRPGMTAAFTVDAYPTDRFQGTIRQIRNAPQSVQNVVTYDAVIDVENPDLRLKPGMTANVTFVYAEKKDVLRIPSAALRFRPSPDLLASAKTAAGAKAVETGGAAGTRRERGPRATERPSADAERPDNASDQRTIWCLRDGLPRPVLIRVGISDGSTAEVVEGDIREGEALITDASSGGSAPGRAPTGAPNPFRRMF